MQFIMSDSPLRQCALPLLCDMPHASRNSREQLRAHGGLDVYLSLLEDNLWSVTALDSIAVCLAHDNDNRKVEQALLKKDAVQKLVMFFKCCMEQHLHILEPFLKIITKSSRINTTLAVNGLTPLLISRVHHPDAIARLKLLKLIKLNDSESLKKFPSKSCPLRYGTAKIQEDALNLFHAALREYVGVYHATMKESNEWAITGLSVSACKIDVIPSGTHSIMKYFHHQNQTCTTSNELKDVCNQDAVSLSSSGTRSTAGLNLADPENDVFEDEAEFGLVMPGSRPDGDGTERCKDDIYTNEAADKKDLSGKEQSVGLQEGTVSSSCLETEIGLELQHTQLKMDVLGPGLKSEEKKRKSEKGTSSILRFFQSEESSSLREHADLKTFQESGASSSGKKLQGNSQQTIIGRTGNSGSDAWIYKTDEIDPSVLNELPPEIQAEVRAWTRPQKQANTVKKRGSSIAHYFSPSANS